VRVEELSERDTVASPCLPYLSPQRTYQRNRAVIEQR
jgi:hypothetical protein